MDSLWGVAGILLVWAYWQVVPEINLFLADQHLQRGQLLQEGPNLEGLVVLLLHAATSASETDRRVNGECAVPLLL